MLRTNFLKIIHRIRFFDCFAQGKKLCKKIFFTQLKKRKTYRLKKKQCTLKPKVRFRKRVFYAIIGVIYLLPNKILLLPMGSVWRLLKRMPQVSIENGNENSWTFLKTQIYLKFAKNLLQIRVEKSRLCWKKNQNRVLNNNNNKRKKNNEKHARGENFFSPNI